MKEYIGLNQAYGWLQCWQLYGQQNQDAAKANSGSIIQYQLALISSSTSPRLTEVVQVNPGTSQN